MILLTVFIGSLLMAVLTIDSFLARLRHTRNMAKVVMYHVGNSVLENAADPAAAAVQVKRRLLETGMFREVRVWQSTDTTATRSKNDTARTITVNLPLAKGGILSVRAALDNTMIRDTAPSLLSPLVVCGLGMLLLGVCLYAVFAIKVLYPLSRIMEGVERVLEGDYTKPVTALTARGDMQKMVTAFNSMMKRIRESRADMEKTIEQISFSLQEKEQQLIRMHRTYLTGRIASSILHDLGAPLAGIVGAVPRLKDDYTPPDKRRRYLEMMEESARGMMRTISELRRFMKGEDEQEPLRTGEVVEEAVAMVRNIAYQRGQEIHVNIGNDTTIHARRSDLRHAVVNLLLNAIEASPERGKITVHCEKENEEVIVRISDEGEGMNEAEAEEAFTPFFSKGKKDHMGLGLTITRLIVERHGGRLEMRSAPGKGTEVAIRMRMKDEKGGAT